MSKAEKSLKNICKRILSFCTPFKFLSESEKIGSTKIPKQRCCHNMFHQIFGLYAAVTSCKKSEKFNASIWCKNQKTHFGQLFVQKFHCNMFLKKIIIVNFKHLYCCNFKQKITVKMFMH